MKNIKRFICIFLLLIFLIPSTKVLSRAGGGGGGGGGGGSSYSSSSGSGSSSGVGFIGMIVFLGGFLFINKKNNSISTVTLISTRKKILADLNELKINDPAWNFCEIETQIEDSFPLIQEAWMNRDYSPVRHLMTEDFYNTHTVKMNWMALRGEKNILKNIKLKKVIPMVAVENDENGDDYIWILLEARMIDYTINEKDNIITDGDPSMGNSFQEFWKFIKKDGKWLADTILQIDEVSPNFFNNQKIRSSH